MNKLTKIWLIVAAALILIGSLLFVGGMAMFKWDFSKLSTVKYNAVDYEIDGKYKNISVVTKSADVMFVLSDDAKTKVDCYEQQNLKHSVTVKDGTLVIEVVDTRKWYEYIGINFGNKIIITIPKGEYGSLLIDAHTGKIEIPEELKFENAQINTSTGNVLSRACVLNALVVKTSTGKIKLEGVTVGSAKLSVSTGDVELSDIVCDGDLNVKVSTAKVCLDNVKCNNFTSNGNTGDVDFKKVISTGTFTIERSTGDVKFDECDAAEIFVTTDTGNVKGTLLSDKIFITNSDTGKVEVPHSTTGGKCEITTDTGNIIFK